ncbi:hypothetical protein DFH08DRAFT_842240 [Mycena albidolilacea]|uniref:Stealth protein CR1 conserved region 1 domain-containing protein n=1 Tax=Mycena albidolilacea TaxID=1033008 RepID=A0AAD7AJG5_9AGAR|nr:hypothetical protein DFH08DRAFT_842240 [Mycena albidolilacea]
MIPTHRPASAYPNRRGCQPLKVFFLRRRKYVLVLSSMLLIWVLVQLVQQSRDKAPAWQPVYHPFNLPSSNAAVADTRIRSIASQATLSDDCVEQWIAHGIWGSYKVDESRIDLIYTWVNGSDPLHYKARQKALANITVNRKPKEARFREHDELRYSLRSVRKATSSWKYTAVHLVTADINPEDPSNPDGRLGLVPQWLNMDSILPRSEDGPMPVYLHHDSELFHLIPTGPGKPSSEKVYAWRNKTLPTFNSHAIESQLPNLDPELVSENIITLNDDNFLMLELPPSAYHSPLYGPVILFQTDRLIVSDDTGTLDGSSELRSLAWSNHLLDERFGARRRPYVMHNARAFSLPLLHEASLAFGQYFSATPLSHIRGAINTPPDLEVNMIFLGSHFVVERHREALLWSWIVAKWGSTNGMLDPADKDKMWEELGGTSDRLRALWPGRTSRIEVTHHMHQAGIREPFSDFNASQPRPQYAFVSGDGYIHSYLPIIPDTPSTRHVPDLAVLSNNIVCEISRQECLGFEAEPAWDLFKRALAEQPSCGDCFISALVRASGRQGLDIFLPPATNTTPSHHVETLPLVIPSAAPPFPENPRKFALRLIYRYNYSLGTSLTKFIMMANSRQGRTELERVDANPDIALLCINDDLPQASVKPAEAILRSWFEHRWPDKLECEL